LYRTQVESPQEKKNLRIPRVKELNKSEERSDKKTYYMKNKVYAGKVEPRRRNGPKSANRLKAKFRRRKTI